MNISFEDSLKIHQREKILRIVEEGSKSEYWEILSSEIKRQIKVHEDYLNRINLKTLTDKQLNERNEVVFKLKFMKWFLNINEKIICDQSKFFDRFKSAISNFKERTLSYVQRR